MLILLSSSKRKRYRDDILRCLAAPIGTRVQFRYSERLVEHPIWERPATYEGHRGLVCSVDLSVVGKPCPLVPVRHVTVEKIYQHGTTMSVVLVIGDLALTDDVDRVTSEIDTRSGGKVPRNTTPHDDAEGASGLFFFGVEGDIGYVKSETTVRNWENTTRTLYKLDGYEKEPFFWTVLGMLPGATDESKASADVNRFVPWDEKVDAQREYTLLVYVFHPMLDRWDPGTCHLRLSSYPEIVTSYPLDVMVDSPYDVKRWRFSVRSPVTYRDARGWLRVGPTSTAEVASETSSEGSGGHTRTKDGGKPEWEIDLPIRIAFSRVELARTTALIGLLLAAPGVISIWLQSATVSAKLIASLVAFAAGWGAAALAAFRISRTV